MRFATRGLHVRYPVQEQWAVHDVSVEMVPGQVTWLTGALGSGTSTLLLALAGLAPRLTGGSRTGTVTADDVDVATISPLSHGIAYLGPSPALQISGISKSVHDEIAVGPMNLGMPREACLQATQGALHRLGVEHLADRAPNALSGGETQRVLIAALLATAPIAWLLDEPFSALDRASTVRVQRLLRELAGDGGTVVVACDDANIMLDVADRLLVMHRGRIALDGNPRELLAGDAMHALGAGSTDAAELARDAGVTAPRPVDRAALLELVASRGVRGH